MTKKREASLRAGKNVKGGRTFVFDTRLLRCRHVSRKIAVPSTFSLYKLAEVIIDAYGFDFDHAFGFYTNITEDYYGDSERTYDLFTDMIRRGEDIESTGAGSVEQTSIADVWQKPGDRMMMLFDYGDDWRFAVELTAIQEGRSSAMVLESIGRAPEQYS